MSEPNKRGSETDQGGSQTAPEGNLLLPLILTAQDLSWLRKLKLGTMAMHKLPAGSLSRLSLGDLIGHPDVEKTPQREYRITPSGRILLDWLDDPTNQGEISRLNDFPVSLAVPHLGNSAVCGPMYTGSQTSPLTGESDSAANQGAGNLETGCE